MRRSRSRSGRKPQPVSSRKSRSRSRRGRKPPTARSASPSEESSNKKRVSGKPGQAPDEEEPLPLEARVALLEVENETLKAENRELRKKLVEALTKKTGAAESSNDRRRANDDSGAGAPSGDRRLERAKAAEDQGSERRRGRDPPADDSGDRRRGGGMGQAPSPVREKEPPKKKREPEAAPDDDMLPNAIMLVNGQMEVYNIPIANNIPPEKRLPLVKDKMDKFMASYDDKIQILDLASGKPIMRDRKMFSARYTCVMRESGAKLKGSCQKRFYYDAPGSKATYCLDYEQHDSLVTAMAGTPPDGNLGVREARTEHLIVLYEAKGGKITRMWLRQDADKIGKDTYASEEIIARSEAFKAFEAKIAECKDGKAGERIFHNYHDIPTVG